MTFGAFATLMILIAGLAYLNPDIGKTGGVLRPEITANLIATSVVFFITGLTLPLHGFSKVLKNWKVLLLTQSFAFIMFPCIMMVFIFVLKQYPIHQSVLVGFKILSTLPPSVSTASILTKLVGGNVATSSMNSLFGSILGMLLTPVYIEWLEHSQEDVPHLKICRHLILIAVFPFIVGQFVHHKYRWLQHNEAVFTFGQVVSLYCFYARVCIAFSKEHMHHAIDWYSLVMTVIMMISFHTVMKLVLLFSSHHVFRHSAKDAVAIMFVASRKSLSLGLPIITVAFENFDEVGYLYLPMLIYSPTQILIGGISVQLIKQWLARQNRRRRR